MISLVDVYNVLAATVPLYVVVILAYISVKWWKIFTPDQCSGINKFVANFSIPLLAFQLISNNNPYQMKLKLILSDFLQKALAFCALGLVAKFSARGSLRWVITGLSLSTLPNTLILGIPLLKAMYGDEAAHFVAQIVVLQSIVWYNILLFLLELDATIFVYVAEPSYEATEELEAPQQEAWLKEREKATEGAPKTKTLHIVFTVARKLVKNPNTHATVAGLVWASVRFRNAKDLNNSILILLSNGGLGMAMFSIGTCVSFNGLFMASQASLIACGARNTILAMVMKFISGPSLMALSSIAIGLKGRLLKVAIVQAALPQAIVPFVFAKEYNVHPEILSTGVIFGMLVAIPVALAYYIMLAL